MESILNGLIDLHVHAGPSVADRAIDAFEMYERASRRGYKAFVVKDHYFPTMMSAMLVQKHTRSAETQIFGQIVLNNSVGGINLKAVDIACSMGAKIVTMPTVSAFHHIKAYQERSFCGGNSKSVQETPIYYLDECGKVKPVVIALLHYLAGHPDIILATGHGSPAEIDALLHNAVELGVKRMLVNHPFCLVEASMAQMIEWAELGAFIEINACDVDPVSTFADGSLAVVRQIFQQISLDRIIISSDYGQAGNIEPVEGMEHFIKLLMSEFGLTHEQVEKVAKFNPGWLLGLQMPNGTENKSR